MLVPSNTNAPGTEWDSDYTIAWEWAFDGEADTAIANWDGGTAPYTDAKAVDFLDTVLGDLAAGPLKGVDDSNYNLNVNFDLSIRIEQID